MGLFRPLPEGGAFLVLYRFLVLVSLVKTLILAFKVAH